MTTARPSPARRAILSFAPNVAIANSLKGWGTMSITKPPTARIGLAVRATSSASSSATPRKTAPLTRPARRRGRATRAAGVRGHDDLLPPGSGYPCCSVRRAIGWGAVAVVSSTASTRVLEAEPDASVPSDTSRRAVADSSKR
jgi:hypothetical protein